MRSSDKDVVLRSTERCHVHSVVHKLSINNLDYTRTDALIWINARRCGSPPGKPSKPPCSRPYFLRRHHRTRRPNPCFLSESSSGQRSGMYHVSRSRRHTTIRAAPPAGSLIRPRHPPRRNLQCTPRQCPQSPRKRSSSGRAASSELCQQETTALQQFYQHCLPLE